jgi:transitional endoplasmic reticulum ATPase
MELTVKPIDKQDAGNGLAVIDPGVMREVGIESGDHVVIEGRQGDSAVARVRPDAIEGVGKVIRIDGQLRHSAGVMIGESVSVEPADIDQAERVTIALPQDLTISGNVGLYVRDQLTDRVVTGGQALSVGFGFESGSRSDAQQRAPVKVVDTEPSGTVAVQEWTDIMVSEKVSEEVSIEDTPDEQATGVTYEDIGGLDSELDQVRELIEIPMHHPELFHVLGINPPNGLLLYGPPGTGKTLLAKAIESETDTYFRTISGPEIISKYRGESEERLREVFAEVEENEPAIVFIDEIDSIAGKREEGDDTEQVVTQLLSLMDGLGEQGQVAVIGTTNRLDAIDPALRRPGRFDREIEIGVPDEEGRKEILQIHTRDMPLDGVDPEAYAAYTHGFVGADLENLAKESAMCALRRVQPDIDLDEGPVDAALLESLSVTEDDFEAALHGIEPSALREVFVEVPDISWGDVGGLSTAKERLRETVQWPLEFPDAFERVDLRPAKGVLLYGPPGTGKTLLAKAVANEAQSNFISIKGPELLDKYVGESERGIREVFSKARENAPTVVFFDEIDAMATERGQGGDANVGERVVSQLLTELDGLEALEDVVVIAATNRPDLIDDALVRPGRLDRHVHVSIPDENARREIFSVHTQDKPLADDIPLADLAARTDGYVGADIEAVCREASTAAVREYVRQSQSDGATSVTDIDLTLEHFEQAFDEVASQTAHSDRQIENAGEDAP